MDNGIKLWIDDCRPAPDNSWTVAKNYWEAIEILQKGNIVAVAFDHDLGSGSPTGYDIANWLEEQVVKNGYRLPRNITIHTDNPTGRKNICAAIQSARRFQREMENEQKVDNNAGDAGKW